MPHLSCMLSPLISTHVASVFHGALLIFACLQVHQTRTALVTMGDDCTGAPGSLEYIVRITAHSRTISYFLTLTSELRWTWNALAESRAIPHHCAMCHCSCLGSHAVPHTEALFGIRVSKNLAYSAWGGFFHSIATSFTNSGFPLAVGPSSTLSELIRSSRVRFLCL